MPSRSSKPHVLRPIILGVLGAILLYAGTSGLVQGSLLYGRHHPVVLTPTLHPFAFWLGILVTCGFGVGALGVSLGDIWSLGRYYTGGSPRGERSPGNPVAEPSPMTNLPDDPAPGGRVIAELSVETPLKRAFAAARAENNIDLVLPALKAAALYVVVGSEPQRSRRPEWFLTKSPTEGRSCVTAAESETALATIRWPKVKLSGAELLQVLPAGIEIIILYAGAGADYLSREQLDWYRQSAA